MPRPVSVPIFDAQWVAFVDAWAAKGPKRLRSASQLIEEVVDPGDHLGRELVGAETRRAQAQRLGSALHDYRDVAVGSWRISARNSGSSKLWYLDQVPEGERLMMEAERAAELERELAAANDTNAREAEAAEAARAEKAAKAAEAAKTKRAGATPAAALPIEARTKLRGTVARLMDYLDSDEWKEDPKCAADAARALDILLGRCPDILTFDEKTNGKAADGAADREEAAAKVRAALDVEDDE